MSSDEEDEFFDVLDQTNQKRTLPSIKIKDSDSSNAKSGIFHSVSITPLDFNAVDNCFPESKLVFSKTLGISSSTERVPFEKKKSHTFDSPRHSRLEHQDSLQIVENNLGAIREISKNFTASKEIPIVLDKISDTVSYPSSSSSELETILPQLKKDVCGSGRKVNSDTLTADQSTTLVPNSISSDIKKLQLGTQKEENIRKVSLTSGDYESKENSNSPNFGRVKLLHQYFKDAVSAVKSATKNKIFNQDETTSSEDDEVVGRQGLIIRSARRMRNMRDFLLIKPIQEIKTDHNGSILAMRFSPCGRLLATAGYDRNIRIWVLRNWKSCFLHLQNTSLSEESKRIPSTSGEMNFREQDFPNFEDDFLLGDNFSISSEITWRTDDGASVDSSSTNSPEKSTNSRPKHSLSNANQQPASTATFSAKAKPKQSGPFDPIPLVIYRGHGGSVTEIAWSKNLFILSTSKNHEVRLWHIIRRECLALFNHNDNVTSVVFHPTDDRYFISGSYDGKLRLWYIPDKVVREWVEVPLPNVNTSSIHMKFQSTSINLTSSSSTPVPGSMHSAEQNSMKTLVTCAVFACDANKIITGTVDGRIIFFNNSLVYITSISIKPRTPKVNQQYRITGIELDPKDSNKILVTSNDSRVRLIDARDYHTLCKYRGFVNELSQIRASFSPSGSYIISGSENSLFYIWRRQVQLKESNNSLRMSLLPGSTTRKDRNKYWEAVKAHDDIVTVAIFSPNPRLILDKTMRKRNSMKNLLSSQFIDSIRPNSNEPTTNQSYVGDIIISADSKGRLRVFKNRSPNNSFVTIKNN